jgi:hypothetical protein
MTMLFPANARLIFLTDELTRDRYLVDTGATLIIVSCNSKTTPSGPLLKGADGQPIPSWGQFQGKLFSLQFLQATVAGPILGIDFLRRFKVTVAPETSQIFFACTAAALSAPQSFLPSFDCLVPPPAGTPSPPTASPDRVHHVKPASFVCQQNQSIMDPPSPLCQFLASTKCSQSQIQCLQTSKFCFKFPILRTRDVKPTPQHGVEHHIHTGSHPLVFAKSRHLDPEKLKIAKWNSKGWNPLTSRRSKSPRASPLHMVPKKDGSFRPCGDYRHLNLVTTLNKYLLPNMQDLSNGLHGCSVFSKIDFVRGYHQIPVAGSDNPKTAIITPFGLFEYLFTPFGLSNAARTFQRMMDCTTEGLEGVFAYMDDSHVGSLDRQTHLRHLKNLFNALATNALAINLEKCVFAVPFLEILGHKISAAGAAPTATHTAKIELCPPPQDIKQLQRFLGMVNLYHHFLPSCAQVLCPLTDLLRGGGGGQNF